MRTLSGRARGSLVAATALVAAATLLVGACDGFVKIDDPSDAGDAQPPPPAVDATPTADVGAPDAPAPPDAAPDGPAPPADAAADATADATPDAAADGAADAARDAADAGTPACTRNPVAGQPCGPGATACGDVDLCCTSGNKFRCTAGVWESYASGMLCLFCAPTPCGTVTCPGNQYCVERADVGGTLYRCVDYPAACSDSWTCDCVSPLVPSCGGGTCRSTASHHLTIECPP
jgi:hypothetical protein